MAGRNYQTAVLRRGRHRSPDEGVCVIELATMLAGASFSDHCRRIDPSISAFLRGYNDQIDSRRRVDLKSIAPAVIDSRGTRALASRRAQLAIEFALAAPPPPLFALQRRKVRREFIDDDKKSLQRAAQRAGEVAGNAARMRTAQHARTLEFINELIALNDGNWPPTKDPAPPAPRPVAPAGSGFS